MVHHSFLLLQLYNNTVKKTPLDTAISQIPDLSISNIMLITVKEREPYSSNDDIIVREKIPLFPAAWFADQLIGKIVILSCCGAHC